MSPQKHQHAVSSHQTITIEMLISSGWYMQIIGLQFFTVYTLYIVENFSLSQYRSAIFTDLI